MFNIGWPELLLIGFVALVALGPKDLPRVMLQLGRMARRAQQFAAGLQAQWQAAVHEAEFQELAERTRKLTDEAMLEATRQPPETTPAANDKL